MKFPFIGYSTAIKTPFVQPDESEISSFLGLFEGKRKARIIKEKADAAVKVEEAKRQTLNLQIEAEKQGYKAPEVRAAEAETAKATIEAKTENSFYLVIAGIVLAVMGGLYLIKRK
jgi:LPXTG-motif cell wall-anchored protein